MIAFVIWYKKYEGTYVDKFGSKDEALKWINEQTRTQDLEYFGVECVIEGRELKLEPVSRVMEYSFK